MMEIRKIASGVFALVILVSQVAIAEPVAAPSMEPMVTTLVESHPGWVGGMLVDQLGYIYIADFQESVWRLNPVDLKMKRFATGFYGSSGNTFDRNGNLYQSNFYGHSISRISRTGDAEIVVDDGLDGPVGMVFTKEGDLLVCSCNDQKIQKVDAAGKVSTFATSEHFNCPNGITQDEAGNVYVVSFASSKVVKITPEGEASLFADSKGRGLGHITYVQGTFYATSYADNKVFRINSSGEISHFAGTGDRGQKDGTAGEALFSNPNGIYADPSGTYLYINDYLGDPTASGVASSPFSIRRIELPSLVKILDHSLIHESIEAMRAAHKAFTSRPGFAAEGIEAPINQLGWKYLLQDKFAEAVAVFEVNVATHPDSWRVYSSLGAGYMKQGNDKRAIQALETSLKLNPENGIAKERLKTLRGANE